MFGIEDITPELVEAVDLYLRTRAFAETTRKAVDRVQREILAASPLSNDWEQRHGEPPRLITEPSEAYLCTDEAAMAQYYQRCDSRLRRAGLKPEDMPFENCPALVAESVASGAVRVLVIAAMPLIDGDDKLARRILLQHTGKRQRFIDLVVGLVLRAKEQGAGVGNGAKQYAAR